MKLTESLRISWRAITGHKLRSSLTTLGIIIGVGAVIVFMVLGGAFEQNIIDDIDSDQQEPGMWVNTQQSVNGGVRFVDAPIYTEQDVSQLEQIDGVKYVAPEAQLPAVQMRHGEQKQTGTFSVQATSTDLVKDSNFTAGEAFSGSNEMVLTEAIVSLMDDEVGVGDDVQVSYRDGSTTTFTVTGIIEEQAAAGQTPTAYVGLDHYQTTIQTPDGDTEMAYSSLIITTTGPGVVDDVKSDANSYLQEESDAAQLKQEEYDIKVQTTDDAIDQISSVIDQLTILIGGIAGISLVVGSIGIANIMIVSVTERTREIGIMKAIGARKRDVIQLFIVESIILGVIGAIFGVAVGIGVGYLGVTVIGWPMVYPMEWVAIAVAIGMTVGVLSGLYPAWSAARVDPIKALRHE
jgi:putative ABC transport system permease protein